MGIADALKTHRFSSGEDLEQTRMRYVALYNHQLPQSALKSKTPMRAMKDWYAFHPHLFIKRPYDHPGFDTSLVAVVIRLGTMWIAVVCGLFAILLQELHVYCKNSS